MENEYHHQNLMHEHSHRKLRWELLVRCKFLDSLFLIYASSFFTVEFYPDRFVLVCLWFYHVFFILVESIQNPWVSVLFLLFLLGFFFSLSGALPVYLHLLCFISKLFFYFSSTFLFPYFMHILFKLFPIPLSSIIVPNMCVF